MKMIYPAHGVFTIYRKLPKHRQCVCLFKNKHIQVMAATPEEAYRKAKDEVEETYGGNALVNYKMDVVKDHWDPNHWFIVSGTPAVVNNRIGDLQIYHNEEDSE